MIGLDETAGVHAKNQNLDDHIAAPEPVGCSVKTEDGERAEDLELGKLEDFFLLRVRYCIAHDAGLAQRRKRRVRERPLLPCVQSDAHNLPRQLASRN